MQLVLKIISNTIERRRACQLPIQPWMQLGPRFVNCEEANVGLGHKFGRNQSPSPPPQLLLFPLHLPSAVLFLASCRLRGGGKRAGTTAGSIGEYAAATVDECRGAGLGGRRPSLRLDAGRRCGIVIQGGQPAGRCRRSHSGDRRRSTFMQCTKSPIPLLLVLIQISMPHNI